MNIVIIGSGIGGLATSIRLAQMGHDVAVYEANSYVGGKLSEIRMDGFRFDAGPSLFTMPMYVDELFEFAGETPTKYFQYQRLENVCNYFWEDGTQLSAFADFEKLAKEVSQKLGVKPHVLQKAFDDSRNKYELTGRIFLERTLHKLSSWLSWDVVKAMSRIHQLDIFKTMNQVNVRNLKHPKLVQFFNRFATYNGSNPYQASGILNIIPHFEHHFGAYFPKKGMIGITNSLYELAKRKNVQFHFNQPVEQIIVKKGKANGVQVEGKTVKADIVVSNMDIYPTYKKLLAQEKQPHQILKAERSSSALIFYWGIQKTFPELDLHNILFSDDYQKEFDCLAKEEIYEDPTIYIHISSKFKLDDAPKGCENWFTMINVPFNNGQDWDALIQTTKKNILSKIKRILGVDLEPLLLCEDILDPRSIELRTSSFAGALYGTASNDRMAAFKRHANFSSQIQQLYFCGGSVHPGGGIPLCLLSAKIVSELVQDSH